MAGRSQNLELTKDEEKEAKNCLFLLNHTDMRKYTLKYGDDKKPHIKIPAAELLRVFKEHNIVRSGGKECISALDILTDGPCWEDNRKYYRGIYQQKVKELFEDFMMEKKDGVWTLDHWNEAMATYWNSILNIWEDPVFRPYNIVRKMFQPEHFYTGGLAERTATTFVGHADHSHTDVDIMICELLPGKLIDLKTRPGFTRILLNNNDTKYEKDDSNFMMSTDFNMSNYQMFKHLKPEQGFPSPPDSNEYVISGPAIGVVRKEGKTPVKLYDYVLGFYSKGREWPAIAEEWRHRSRPLGWPSQDLVDNVVSYGTYVVAVAHPFSPEPDIEWRYSFSKPETDLMLSISKKQRKCFMIVKRLCSLTFSGFKLLKTYHIKTAFFWLLEVSPGSLWEQVCMDELVNYLLDKLIFYCSEHNLPHYFIKNANLIGLLPRDHLETVEQKLNDLRWNRYKKLPRYIREDTCLWFIENTVEPFVENVAKLMGRCRKNFYETKMTEEVAEWLDLLGRSFH